MDLITNVKGLKGARYVLCHRLSQVAEKTRLGASLQFEEGIEKTVKWYLENQEWMDHVTSGEYQKYYEGMCCK